jgi:hypothetical protein
VFGRNKVSFQRDFSQGKGGFKTLLISARRQFPVSHFPEASMTKPFSGPKPEKKKN